MSTLSEYKGVLVFTLTYVIGAIIASFLFNNIEFLFYAGIMVVLGGFFVYAHLRIGFPRWLLWAMSIWGLVHMMGGLVPPPPGWPISGDINVLYSMWIIPDYLKYDHIVHAYGFGLMTYVTWYGLQSATKNALKPTFGILVVCVMAATGFGALNEIIEFIISVTIPGTNVGGYINNSLDLIANATGAIIAAWTISYTQK